MTWMTAADTDTDTHTYRHTHALLKRDSNTCCRVPTHTQREKESEWTNKWVAISFIKNILVWAVDCEYEQVGSECWFTINVWVMWVEREMQSMASLRVPSPVLLFCCSPCSVMFFIIRLLDIHVQPVRLLIATPLPLPLWYPICFFFLHCHCPACFRFRLL